MQPSPLLWRGTTSCSKFLFAGSVGVAFVGAVLLTSQPVRAEPPPVAAVLIRSGPIAARVARAVARLRLPVAELSARCAASPACVKRLAVKHKVDMLAVVDARARRSKVGYAARVEVFSGRTGEATRGEKLHGRELADLLARVRTRAAALLGVKVPTAAANDAADAPVAKVAAVVVDVRAARARASKASVKAASKVSKANGSGAPASSDGQQSFVFMLIVVGVLTSGFSLSLLHARKQRVISEALVEKTKCDGTDQPPSLHPVIDPTRCIGCGSCTIACPDRSVLAIVENQARLVTPANCVGIGECEAVCPADAIKLVIGTSKRPVELPRLDTCSQTTVPGLYVAGELGGMGLIANAFEQATQAVDAIRDDLQNNGGVRAEAAPALGAETEPDGDLVDLLVVGAGPAGLGASLRAKELRMSYRCVDQAEWGGAIRAYPRGKLVMTRPIKVPLYGPVKLRETSKEALVELLTRIVEQTGVAIESRTAVERVERYDRGFVVRTSRGAIKARRVLLAIGRRGTPRKLGVPGESADRVAYAMTEPSRWANKQLVVVGGGDVACETALALSEQPGTRVHLLYRGAALSRPKPGNRERVSVAAEQGRIELVLSANIEAVTPSGIQLSTPTRGQHEISADMIFACIGGTPPTKFLAAMGIEVATFTGQPLAGA